MPVARWEMLPYATIHNKISMTAMAATDATSMEYQFYCVSGGGPDSAFLRLAEAARQGDPLAEEIMQHTAHYFSLGLVNIIMLFQPEMIVLSGGVMRPPRSSQSSLGRQARKAMVSARAVPRSRPSIQAPM